MLSIKICFEPSIDLTQLYRTSWSEARARESIQELVGELGQLAAYIAVDLKTAAQSNAVQARNHLQSLNEWHRTLPPPIQLSRLSLADTKAMNWSSKRSLLPLHVLFLGIFTEPFKNCLVDLGRYRLSKVSVDPEDLKILKTVEEQSALAARQSSRVVSLLQIDDLLRSRCWVSVYVSCQRTLLQD
jgi:hypothetical protein